MLKKNTVLTLSLLLVNLLACESDQNGQPGEVRINSNHKGFFETVGAKVDGWFSSATSEKEVGDSDDLHAQLGLTGAMKINDRHIAKVISQVQSKKDLTGIATMSLLDLKKELVKSKDLREKRDILSHIAENTDPDGVKILFAVMESNEPELRSDAAVYLGTHVPDPKVISVLVKALDDPDSGVVLEAIEGLANVQDQKVSDALTEISVNHPDKLVREVALDYVNNP